MRVAFLFFAISRISVFSQFYDPSGLQFLGYAAISIPSYDSQDENEEEALNLLSQSSKFNFEKIIQHGNGGQFQNFQTIPNNLPKTPTLNENGLNLEHLMKSEKEYSENNKMSINPNVLMQQAAYLNLINDKDNFQNSGCGWDLLRLQCADVIGLCKGRCYDYSVSPNSPIRDCRCVPYGYSALLKLAGRK